MGQAAPMRKKNDKAKPSMSGSSTVPEDKSPYHYTEDCQVVAHSQTSVTH